MEDTGYEFFDHTADVGMRVWAKTLPDLFTQAAAGLSALLIENPEQLQPRDTRAVTLRAGSTEELLQRWLKELLFWFAMDRFLVCACAFDAVSPEALHGVARGEPWDLSRHHPGTEVKGVTSHQFHVAQGPQGWEARVIFDV